MMDNYYNRYVNDVCVVHNCVCVWMLVRVLYMCVCVSVCLCLWMLVSVYVSVSVVFVFMKCVCGVCLYEYQSIFLSYIMYRMMNWNWTFCHMNQSSQMIVVEPVV